MATTVPSSVYQIVSATFYDNKLKTAGELNLKRRSYEPCKWVHVSGGEVKHQGRVRPRKELGNQSSRVLHF